MFGLFKRRDPVVEVLVKRIEQCKAQTPSETKQIADPLFDTLANTVSSQWKSEHLANYKAEIARGGKHEAFIFNFIVQVCGDQLESGRHHVHRGILNFQGKLYQQLFEHAINTMIASSEYSKEWADENLREPVYKGIKEVG
ncbi:MAG: hypothetical protein ACYCY9_14100 [Thiobacillus sp.]